MIVHYQPVIEIATGLVVRAEVLCRFPDGANDMRDIGTFITHAEDVGLIHELTQSVLLLALTERESHHLELPLSFNVSRFDLDDPAFRERVAALLVKFAIPSTSITLELNDGIVSIDDGEAFRTMRSLGKSGIRFCVDGFGEHMSTFSHLELERTAVREVKIDVRGYVAATKRATISSIVAIARQLGIDVVAKGVETPACLALVGELGCGFAQGFQIARPMDAAGLVAWLGEHEVARPLPSEPLAVAEQPVPEKASFLSGFFGKRSGK